MSGFHQKTCLKKMNEATWWIVIGLGFDIAGAIFIIKPLLEKFSRLPGVKEDENEEVSLKDEKGKELYFSLNPFSHYARNRQLAWTGLIMLCFGFILQIIGNWIQNPPS